MSNDESSPSPFVIEDDDDDDEPPAAGMIIVEDDPEPTGTLAPTAEPTHTATNHAMVVA